MNEMVLNAYTSQKEPKGINETHSFARNLRLQRGEVGAYGRNLRSWWD